MVSQVEMFLALKWTTVGMEFRLISRPEQQVGVKLKILRMFLNPFEEKDDVALSCYYFNGSVKVVTLLEW